MKNATFILLLILAVFLCGFTSSMRMTLNDKSVSAGPGGVEHYLLIDGGTHFLIIDGASHKLRIDGAN